MRFEKIERGLYFLYPPLNQIIGGSIESVEIEIKNIIPDSLSYSYSPNFSSQNLLGRMSPIQIYSGGSAQEYSFTLTIHEDALDKSKYKNIIEFVDAIKSLSYPRINSLGLMTSPQTYFQIGEISGIGIVSTSHSWKKPFRDGRYAMVDISFNITVESIINEDVLRITEISTDSLTGIVVFATINVNESEAKIKSLLGGLYYRDSVNGYQYSDWYLKNDYPDFINVGVSQDQKNANIAFTNNYFDTSFEKMNRLNSAFAELDKSSEALIKLKASLGNLKSLTTTNGSTNIDIDNSSNKDNVLKELKNLRKLYIEYLDFYYSINKELTREQYNRMLSELEARLDNMEDMYTEVMSYGASN